MKSFHCVVTGDVRKGNFLNWVLDHATNLQLTGWVRSLSDEQIEVLAQGSEENAEKLGVLLKQGSTLTGINSITSDWLDYEKAYDRFEMRK